MKKFFILNSSGTFTRQKFEYALLQCQDNGNGSGQKEIVSKMSINAKHIIEVLVNLGQVQLSKHNIDVITQKVFEH